MGPKSRKLLWDGNNGPTAVVAKREIWQYSYFHTTWEKKTLIQSSRNTKHMRPGSVHLTFDL